MRRPIDRMRAAEDPAAIDPNLLMTDDGYTVDATTLGYAGARGLGAHQANLRRRSFIEENPDAGFSMSRGVRRQTIPGFFDRAGGGLSAFTGLLDAKRNAVEAQGGKMNVDLLGRRGEGGIGFLKQRENDGIAYTESDLARAARMKAAEEERKAKADAVNNPEPYTGPFSRQGAGQKAPGAIDTEGEATVSSTGAKSKALPPVRPRPKHKLQQPKAGTAR